MLATRGIPLLFACAAVFAPGPTGAQSIDPPILVLEGRPARSVSGNMVIANGSLYPVRFVLEPKSFAVSCGGDIAFAPLEAARIHLKLSSMSGRIPAKQRLRVFYTVSTDSLPAWFAIVASFSRSAPVEGLSMRVELPHVVYLMQKDRVIDEDISVGQATYDSVTHTLRLRVENTSPKLTRVLELTVVPSTGPPVAIDACPLFPKSARDFEHVWRQPGLPVTLIVKFPGFSVTRTVSPP